MRVEDVLVEEVDDDVVLMVELLVEVLVEVLLVFVDGVQVEDVEVRPVLGLEVEFEDDILYVVDVEMLVVRLIHVLVDELVVERLGDDVDVDDVSALRWKSKTRWSTKLTS